MNRRSAPFRHLAVWLSLALSAIAFPSLVAAVEFAIVGPRAVGMGGAGVAVTDDALATYWNPAGLAMKRTVDIRVQGSAQITDRLGVASTVKDIQNLQSAGSLAQANANAATVQNLLDRLAQQGASVSAAAAGGIYFKGYWGEHAFGFNVSDVATGGGFFPNVDRNVTVSGSGSSFTLSNSTTMAVRALEARQAGFSYAYAFADRTLSLGATVKVIQGAAYSSSSTNIFTANAGDNFVKSFGKATLTTTYGIDVGALYRPADWIQIGVVGKDLNAPKFDVPGGGQQFQLNPQFRGGLALKPYESLTLTVDGDINKNSTLVPGIKSRVIGAGAEQTLFSGALALRAGALKNVEDAKSIVTPTAGIGLRLWALTLDIGAGYDFRFRQGLASFSLGATF